LSTLASVVKCANEHAPGRDGAGCIPVTPETKLMSLIDEAQVELIILARYMQIHVTPDLDEGPIIEQDVLRVDHTSGPRRLAKVGRDVEAQVLARAVTWHAEHRVLLNGNRTVILH
jgi:formyltetrahydrofolate hydrolase